MLEERNSGASTTKNYNNCGSMVNAIPNNGDVGCQGDEDEDSCNAEGSGGNLLLDADA